MNCNSMVKYEREMNPIFKGTDLNATTSHAVNVMFLTFNSAGLGGSLKMDVGAQMASLCLLLI